MIESEEVIFVYNAKSGFMHSAVGLMHKTVSPNTYPCKLCMLTYSGATMNKLWKHYAANLGVPAVFMHRNEFEKSYPDSEITFPAVLLRENNMLRVLISRAEFAKMTNLNDLIMLLQQKLQEVSLKRREYE